ncbi:MAG: NAD(P)H-binding protein [Chloroflexi bacterium]|nr:NAD(P)H-binding protein [Chloroflexota bacterium]
MRVCVFGGAGFIGSRVVSCLVRSGHEVVAMVRSQQRGAALAQMGVAVKYGDVGNPEDIRKALAGAQIVINATVPNYQGRLGLGRAQAIGKQHLEYTRNILDEAQRAGGLPVIVSEGTLLWGDSGEGWHDEASKLNPLGMGRAGQWSTPYIQKMIEEKNAPIIRLFPGMVYGAGSWFENGVYNLMQKGWFRTFGGGQNIVSVAYVDDVAEAYRLAVEKMPLREVFAIVDDQPVKFRDFANCAARAMGKPPVASMPAWLGSLMAGKAMAETLTMNCRARNTKAREKLGWQPRYVSYEQGIPVAVAEIEKARARRQAS